MLTKDLLQFTHRKGNLSLTFIDESDPGLIKLAAGLVDKLSHASGKSLSEIEESLDEIKSTAKSLDGLKKIIEDQCEFADFDDDICVKRWEIFRTAQDLRDEGSLTDPAEYANVLATRCGYDTAGTVRQELFSDHPDEKKCTKTTPISAENLLSEYNRALFQTIFIFADDVKFTVKGASVVEKRALFRQLKFHSLMSEVAMDPEDATFTVYLSGPLKLFQKSTTYGLRLAKFIPNLLHLKSWDLEASVQLKNKRMTLKLNSQIDVKPKGRGLQGYVPTEFSEIMKQFNESDTAWTVKPGEDFVNIGKQSYCFPDFELSNGKKQIHVELFHSWHKGQLKSRLSALEAKKQKGVILGVDKALKKEKDLSKILEESAWFQKNGFEFNQFPTPKQLMKVVENS